ncbi:MAG: LysR family transcriptional regulator [Pseudomonadota bacterium]
MEIKQLERFLAVADQGSLAAAARELGLTQQAISASLARLESDVGSTLFDRGPGGVTKLTAFGTALLPHARSQLAGDARALDALRALTDAESGVVTVGVGESFAGDIVSEAVVALLDEHPRLRVNLVEGYSEKLLQRLYEGEFDFVAVGVRDYTLRQGYRAENVYQAYDVVACRPGHPLTGRKNLKLDHLVGYPWLVPYSRPADADVIIDAFVEAELAPPTRFLGSDAYRLGMNILARTDVLLMTPPALVTNAFVKDAYAILPLDQPTIRRQASLVRDPNRPLTPAAERLLEQVREVARQFTAGQ